MGYFREEWIEAAGQFLLQKLNTKNPLRYSEIWSGDKSEDLQFTGERLAGIDGSVSFAACIDLV